MNKDVKIKGVIYTLECIVLLFVLAISVMAADTPPSLTLGLINQDPDPAIAGDVLEIRIGIQNNGENVLNDLNIEFIPEYPFNSVIGESSIVNVGNVGAYQGYSGDTSSIKTVKYRILVDKDATAGNYELNFRTYESGSTGAIQSSFDVDIQNKENAEVIYIDKTVLIPGRQTSLKFVINNVGSSPLRDLTFSWINDDKIILPVGSDNTKYIKYIGIGESAELEYQVIADSNADAGLYALDLKLSYEDSISDTDKEIDTIAGVYVGGGTDFELAFSESSGSEMSFTIANIGSNPAFSVSVIVPQQDGWSVNGANSMIIGNLNTGDYTVASFNLQRGMTLDSGTANPINSQNATTPRRSSTQGSILKIHVAYTDTMGNREFVEKNVTMNQFFSRNSTASSSDSFNGQFPGSRMQQQTFWSKYQAYILILLIAVIMIGFVVYYKRYKREKILNPRFKFKELFFGKESKEYSSTKKK
ncbi:MAG: COG1361 S-layer family protein [Candidatus Woesearchaeota archaeon]